MGIKLKIVWGLCIFLCLGAGAEAAGVVSIAELVSQTQKYDGQTVVILGEVIGDIINGRDSREAYVWLNICEQNNIAIGVFCHRELTPTIKYRGSYNAAGDQVRVQGIFHRACPVHNSEVDIHAENITVVQRGGVVAHPVELSRRRLSKNLASLAIVLAIVHLVYSKRNENKKRRLS